MFSCYPIPTDLDKHVVDPTNQRQLQSRRLGFASVKFGSYFYPNITFYEIIEQYKMEEEDDLTEKAALPIKKRRYEQRRRQDIVFCMDRTIEEHISDQLRYYLFPHEAIVEALNGTHMSTFDVSYMLLFSWLLYLKVILGTSIISFTQRFKSIRPSFCLFMYIY